MVVKKPNKKTGIIIAIPLLIILIIAFALIQPNNTDLPPTNPPPTNPPPNNDPIVYSSSLLFLSYTCVSKCSSNERVELTGKSFSIDYVGDWSDSPYYQVDLITDTIINPLTTGINIQILIRKSYIIPWTDFSGGGMFPPDFDPSTLPSIQIAETNVIKDTMIRFYTDDGNFDNNINSDRNYHQVTFGSNPTTITTIRIYIIFDHNSITENFKVNFNLFTMP